MTPVYIMHAQTPDDAATTAKPVSASSYTQSEHANVKTLKIQTWSYSTQKWGINKPSTPPFSDGPGAAGGAHRRSLLSKPSAEQKLPTPVTSILTSTSLPSSGGSGAGGGAAGARRCRSLQGQRAAGACRRANDGVQHRAAVGRAQCLAAAAGHCDRGAGRQRR